MNDFLEKIYTTQGLEANYQERDVLSLNQSLESEGYVFGAGQFGGDPTELLQVIAHINLRVDSIIGVVALNLISSAIWAAVAASKKWWSKKGKPDYGKPVLLVYIYEKRVAYKTIKIMIDEVKSESDIKYQINSKMRK
ncbi:MAG: hypothetical protein WBO35_00970 [Candidatus Saccharimonadales bacterium]